MLQRAVTGFVGLIAFIVILAIPSAASADACSPGTVDKTWDGSSSSDWFDASNWTPQTANPPSQTQDVCIASGTPNAPVIGSGPTATARTIASAETIDVQPSGTLQLFNATEESILQSGITLGDSATLDAAGPLTVHGTFTWNAGATIKGAAGAAKKITLASDGTLTAPAGAAVQRFLDTGTLRIEGSATFGGNTDTSFHQTVLRNGADIEVGGASGARSLNLRDDQLILDGDGPGDSSLRVLAGGTLSRTSAGGPGIADVGIPVENDGTVASGAGILGLSGGSDGQTSSGQYSAAAGAGVGFGGGTHLLAVGAAINGPGTTTITNGIVSASGATTVASNASVVLAGGTLGGAGGVTVHGALSWDNNGTIGDGTTTIASDGTLTAPAGAAVQRFLDTGTLRIEGSATFGGTTDTSFHQTVLRNGADIEVGGASGPRSLNLRDDQLILDGDGPGDSSLRVLAGGTLSRTSAGGPGIADVGIPVENDGTVTVAAGTTSFSGGSSGSSGQWAPAAGGFVNFAGGTHSVGGSTIAGAGTVYGSYEVASGQTVTVNGNYRWDNSTTIAGAGTTLITPSGTLTAPAGAAVQHFLDTGTLRIEGSATFEGNTDTSFHQTVLRNGADIEVGGASGARSLNLRDDQLILDGDGPGDSSLRVLAGGTLSRTSAGGPGIAEVQVVLTVNGTLDVAAGTLASSGAFTNYNPTTGRLTGGTYAVHNGAAFRFADADVRQNAAEIILDGPASQLEDPSSADAIRNLNTNLAAGKLRLRNGRSFARTGAFSNSGLIDLDSEGTFSTSANFTQASTGTFATDIAGTVPGTSFGRLSAGGTANLDGTLDVDVTAYPPHTGDTIDVLTAGTRSGTFAAVTGQGFTVNYLPDRVRITPPTLTIGDRSVTEGDTGSNNMRFLVDLSSPSPGTVTVDYATSNGTAVAPSDYTATSGTVTFAPGQTQRFVDVPVQGDLRDEVNETFNVTLSAPALADVADGAAVGTISDNDPPPAISIDDVTAGEGGASHAFTVSLSQESGRTVSVDYATADGSATVAADYTSKSGTLTFTPGQTTKTVTVNTVDDLLDEADETFTVGLSNPVLSTIAAGSGTGTITDNDPTPSLSIDDVAGSEGTAQTFTLTLAAASGQQVTVDYATADGTAVAPGDYAATTGTLTFAPGQTTKTVTVNTVNDALDEANPQTYTVTLSNAAGATISDASGTGSIADNDPPVSVTITDSPNRREGGKARFDVRLSGPSEVKVRVEFATQNGTAVAPGDYTARSGRLVFKPGVTSRRVLVSSVDDVLDETAETFTLVLSNPIKATIADGSGSARIVDND